MHDKILIEEKAVREARRLRLKQARESSGKLPQEIAALVGIPDNFYYDLEGIDGELNSAVSLGELSKLSSALGIHTRFILDGRTEGNQISPEQLCAKIQAYISATGISTEDFEERVGFVIKPSLRNSAEVLNWNVDCLRFVCEELGLDWRQALP
jgi:hypothetical protein